MTDYNPEPFDRWKAQDEIYAIYEEKGYRRGFTNGFWVGACLMSALITVGLLVVGYLVR